MNIEAMASTLYSCSDDFRDFTVAHMDDRVSLFGEFDGAHMSQMFSYSGEFTPEALRKAFPSYGAATKAALLHTRGILNKKRIEENAVELLKDGVMDALRMHALVDLLKNCNCAPSRFIERLVGNGFIDVVNRLGVYEESPDMRETAQAFLDFIEKFSQ